MKIVPPRAVAAYFVEEESPFVLNKLTKALPIAYEAIVSIEYGWAKFSPRFTIQESFFVLSLLF